MVIPSRQFDPVLITTLKQYIEANPVAFQDMMAAVLIAALELRDSNRTHVAQELKIPLRTLRTKLLIIESLGYTVPPPKRGVAKKI
jgi:DNA-binding NtrC family response regulator